MSNEIKQGDKVRVSKDAPGIYTPDWVDEMFNLVLKVTAVEDGNAMVVFAKRTPYKTVLTTIPCKYLVKVDAEAKEPRFCIGDRVRHIKNDECGIVLDVEADGVYVGIAYSLQRRFWKNREIELVQPKEQTEAKYIKTKGDTLTFPITFDLSDSYWDAYTADLAKEIAVMLVRTHRNDLNKVAKMSVDIAKAVVEGLKRK